MENIVVVGAAGHAKVVLDVLEQNDRYNVIGLIGTDKDVERNVSGYDVLGDDGALAELKRVYDLKGLVVAIGDNNVRAQVVEKITAQNIGIPFVSAVHPRAAIARNVKIGAGTVITAGVCVNAGSVIGAHCILNTNSSLDHDGVMGEYSSLAPRAVTGGNCIIGAYSAVGIGAVISHGIKIGMHSIIGAGATVLNNIEGYCVAYGTPAKLVRVRGSGDPYL